MVSVSAATRAAIAEEMADAPYGARRRTAETLAKRFGISVAGVYRYAQRGGTGRQRAPRCPVYRDWTRTAVRLAQSAPGRAIPLDIAIRAGVESGELPPEAAEMPIGTAYRIARELGFSQRDQAKRTHRLHADYPMQAVQIDGSTSEYLVASRELEGGDWELRLHRRPYSASGYKNKPLGPDRMRVLLYAIWDMCTGYVLSRYCVARGETAMDALDFFCWALAEKADRRVVFHGVPDHLWSDQGPLFKSRAARDLLERLDISLELGLPYQKTRMGGVERTHRTRWSRFESALFLRGEDQITLSELNGRLLQFEIAENARRVARVRVDGRDVTRTQAWVALTNARPTNNPLRRLPDNPLETLSRERRRKVDVNGIVRWEGTEYEVEGWCDRWVIARRGMVEPDLLTLEDERSGERRTARPHCARAYGEIRGTARTPLEQLCEERQDEKRTHADIYAPSVEPPRIVPFPGRSTAPAVLDDPLDAGRHRNIQEAMRAFFSIYSRPLSGGARHLVMARIQASGLDKRVVTALAQELLALRRTS